MAPLGTQPFRVYNVTMTGAFIEFEIPNAVNSLLIQNRAAVDIQVADAAAGTAYITVKSGNSLSVQSFNTNNQSLFIRGTAGNVVEIMAQIRP